MKSKVSIIIPCYNNKNTIYQTVESVYNQTHKNIEIIVIDDGSEEDIENEINFFNTNDNFYYEKIKNSGVSFARNLGVKKASGDFLLFLDADDLIDSTYIEKCLSSYENDNNLKIVYSEARFFDAEESKWDIPKYDGLKRLLIGNCIPVCAIIKKEDFEKANGFDTNLDFYEDWDLWISILKNGGTVHQIKEELFFYRKHKIEKSASDKATKNKKTHAHNRLKIYAKHVELYDTYFNNFEYLFLSQFKFKEIVDRNYYLENKLKKIESNIFYKLFKKFSLK